MMVSYSFYIFSLFLNRIAKFCFSFNKGWISRTCYTLATIFLITGFIVSNSYLNMLLVLSITACLLLEKLIPAEYSSKVNSDKIHGQFYYIISVLVVYSFYAYSNIFNIAEFSLKTIFYSFLGVLILDLKNYVVHRMQHKFKLWWNFHLIHHNQADINFFSLGPVNLIEFFIFRLSLNVLIIYMLGLPLFSVVLYESCFVMFGVWGHANFKMHPSLDFLSWIVVTPKYHRVHHRFEKDCQNSNFGDCFTIWDTLFGTRYKEIKLENLQPARIRHRTKDFQSGLFKEQFEPFVSLIKPFFINNKKKRVFIR